MITSLFTYNELGEPESRESTKLSLDGIEGNRSCHIWRQVLLFPESSIQLFGLNKTDLKENIIIKTEFDIHDLPSGTVIRLGEVELRLTFHCEPCKKIRHVICPKKIIHKRGYLGQIVKSGNIRLSDSVTVLDRRYESIPYEIAERVKWYLSQQDSPVMVSKLVEDIGLSRSYCRAIPNIIRNRDDIDKDKIKYSTNNSSNKKHLIEYSQFPLEF